MNVTLALDFGRRCTWLGLLLCGPTCAEPLKVDESKLPDWVKRQAQMPYRVIIQSPVSAPAAPATSAQRRPVATLPKKPAMTPAVLAGSDATPGRATAAADIDTPMPAQADPFIAPTDAAQAALAEAALSPPVATPAALPQPDVTAPTSVEPLTLLARVEPSVSIELLNQARGEMQVTVAFTVQPDGQVSDPQVLSSSDSRLSRAVLRSLSGWRYAPIPQARQHAISFAFVAQP